MPTPFSIPIERFLHRIEEDRDFFQYFNLSNEEAMSLAYVRSKHYLADAADRIMIECSPEIDFCDRDDVLEQFAEDLTPKEVFLIASIMYEYYLAKDIAKLKTYEVNYTGSNLRVFSPSEARDSFRAIYQDVCSQNEALLDLYHNTNRLTGAYKGIDYASYNEEES